MSVAAHPPFPPPILQPADLTHQRPAWRAAILDCLLTQAGAAWGFGRRGWQEANAVRRWLAADTRVQNAILGVDRARSLGIEAVVAMMFDLTNTMGQSLADYDARHGAPRQ